MGKSRKKWGITNTPKSTKFVQRAAAKVIRRIPVDELIPNGKWFRRCYDSCYIRDVWDWIILDDPQEDQNDPEYQEYKRSFFNK